MGVVLVVCCAVTVTPSTPRRHLVTAAVALAVAVQAVVLYAPEAPGPPSPIPHGDKAVHAMVFALPVLVAGLGVRGWRARFGRMSVWVAVEALANPDCSRTGRPSMSARSPMTRPEPVSRPRITPTRQPDQRLAPGLAVPVGEPGGQRLPQRRLGAQLRPVTGGQRMVLQAMPVFE